MIFELNNGSVKKPTIILSSRNHDFLGQINNVDSNSFSFKRGMNGNEITFNVKKIFNDYVEPLWDDIYDLRFVYIKELDEFFEISVSATETTYNEKTITGTTAARAELSQVLLYNFNVNNENDQYWDEDNDTYYPTCFYRPDPDAEHPSLLHRILDKAPGYSIGYVEETLWNLQRSFSIDSTSIHDALVGSVAEQFNCYFDFDSVTRTISAYDLYTTCNNIESHPDTWSQIDEKYIKTTYRGDFTDVCPKCGSSRHIIPKSHNRFRDTGIFVTTKNLTDNIQFETDTGSIKNCFKLEAGDDNMNAAIRMVNPNGSDYLYYFSDESKRDMPKELVDKLNSYDKLINYYMYDFPIVLGNYMPIDLIDSYNDLVQKYQAGYTDLTDDSLNYLFDFNGNTKLSAYIYENIGFQSYLESVMMPVTEKTGAKVTANTEAEKINNASISEIALSSLNMSTSKSTIDSAMQLYIKTFIKSGYVRATVLSSSITKDANGVPRVWSGKFEITNYSDDKDVATTNDITVAITTDYATFMQQKIVKSFLNTAEKDDSFDVLNSTIRVQNNIVNPEDIEKFKESLGKYCLKRLESFKDACSVAMGILMEVHQDNTQAIVHEFYLKYQAMFAACEEIYNQRANELEVVRGVGLTNEDGKVSKDGIYQGLFRIKADIVKALDIKDYLGDYYNLFTYYRREDKYSNSNYISDNLSTRQQFANAQTFYEKASEELFKSGNHQHSISTNLYNLLAMDEFQPLLDEYTFEVGNYIRVKMDDVVYRLRLTEYTIDFSDLTHINTQFSDMTRTATGLTDVANILASASNMATSYGFVESQAATGKESYNTLDSAKKYGFNSAYSAVKDSTAREVLMDSSGIILKKYNDIEGTYDSEQTRLTHNMICFTDDDWKTVTTGLGKQSYTYYDDGFKTSVGYGLNAKFVNSGYIYGSQIISGDIYSTNYDGKTGSRINLDNGFFEFFAPNNQAMWSDNTGLHIRNLPIETITVDTDGKTLKEWITGAGGEVDYLENNKMDKLNPSGVGSMSMNRKEDSLVGNYSSTFGYSCVANAYCSSAKGYNTTASGYYSSSEGYGNTSTTTTTYDNIPYICVYKDSNRCDLIPAGTYSVSAVSGGTFRIAEIGDPDANFVISSYFVGKITINLIGTGYIGSYVNIFNLGGIYHITETTTPVKGVAGGIAAHSEGQNCIASDYASHAEGTETVASNYYTHSEGATTTASGEYSHAEGSMTISDGYIAHSEGFQTRASGNYSHSEGCYAHAYGDSSHAEGNMTGAKGAHSHVEGYESHSSGDHSHAEGHYTNSCGDSTHTEGNDTIAVGLYGHAEGYGGSIVQYALDTKLTKVPYYVVGTTILGSNTFELELSDFSYGIFKVGNIVEIEYSYVQLASSFVEIVSTDDTHKKITVKFIAGTYLYSTAFKYVRAVYSSFRINAEGNYSHSEGYACISKGESAHSEGYTTKATGNYSHSEGYDTEASGMYSHAGGLYTDAPYQCLTAIGNTNDPIDGDLFEVGNGFVIWGYDSDGKYTKIPLKRNAMRVTGSGEVVAQTDFIVGDHKLTEKVSVSEFKCGSETLTYIDSDYAEFEVVFTTPYDDDQYTITLSANTPHAIYYEDKTAGGFKIKMYFNDSSADPSETYICDWSTKIFNN